MNNDMKWKSIETAPKDRPVLAWCDHEADPFYEDEAAGRLTIYAGHYEAMSHVSTGYHIVEWGGGFSESTFEYPDGAHMPDWWFVAESDFEVAANPLYWLDIDLSVVPTISQ